MRSGEEWLSLSTGGSACCFDLRRIKVERLIVNGQGRIGCVCELIDLRYLDSLLPFASRTEFEGFDSTN